MLIARFLSFFFFFAESSSPSHWRTTLKTFIFSLRNSESLPPFKYLAKYAYRAIYRSLYFGPSFGRKPDPYVRHRKSRSRIGAPYSVPPEVRNSGSVLGGTAGSFSPDNYEVFYLA